MVRAGGIAVHPPLTRVFRSFLKRTIARIPGSVPGSGVGNESVQRGCPDYAESGGRGQQPSSERNPRDRANPSSRCRRHRRVVRIDGRLWWAVRGGRGRIHVRRGGGADRIRGGISAICRLVKHSPTRASRARSRSITPDSRETTPPIGSRTRSERGPWTRCGRTVPAIRGSAVRRPRNRRRRYRPA